MYKNPGPNYEPITSKEMNGAIKNLKRKKSLRPDGTPNGIFIEAEPETRNILSSIIQEIHNISDDKAGIITTLRFQSAE